MPASANYLKARKTWAVDFHQHGVRWQVTKGIRNKEDAEALAKRATERMTAGEDLRPADKRPASAATSLLPATATSGITLRAFASHFLVEEAAAKKASTNDYYEGQLRLHILPAIGDLEVARIDRGVVKKLLRDLIGKISEHTDRRIRNKTREAIHATLCVVLEAAVDQQLIPYNPALRLRNKHMHDPDQLDEEIQVWTPDEVARFLRVCQQHAPHWFPFFFVALRTGLRLGELTELRWEKDFKHAGKLHVQRSYSYRKRKKIVLAADGTYEKVEAPDQQRITSTKGKKKRLVDLFPPVEDVLKALRATQRAVCFQRGQTPSLVFTGVLGRKISDVTIGKVMRKLEVIAEVPRLTIHGLRHTYATINLSRGEDLHYISAQLGHADVATTERHYKHWIPDDAEMVERRRKRHLEIWKATGESAGH